MADRLLYHMKSMVSLLLLILILLVPLSGCIGGDNSEDNKPIITIEYPHEGDRVSSIVKIVGTAEDPDKNDRVKRVEVSINDSSWELADGTIQWSYDWITYKKTDGFYVIKARAWDGEEYSDIAEVTVYVNNPKTSDSDAHKWAVFVAAANYPEDNESKLGNGGYNLAEEIATYLIETCNYPTSNVFILFDDGWIRDDNGFGKKNRTLQEISHPYNINYGGATKENVKTILYHVISEANQYPDSEVFLWFFGHGWGDENNKLTGGKILERSAIFLWDDVLTDRELGDMLYNLRSHKTCIIVDACFSGGFADKTIYEFPTFFLLHSGIPGAGRVVITSASKFRTGYASTTRGPIFSLLWFQGIKTGEADGFRAGFRSTGKPSILGLFKNGKVSVEEAFYYARYLLRTDPSLAEFSQMEPQINDQYPRRGTLRSQWGLFL